MDLNILWFVLIAVLYSGFFILEGFDFGVGILLPFLGKKDAERRVIINSIGPTWDANEVWLILAGGATFAAFPHWYATLFAGFYLPLFLVLVALIFRGVALEFRGKVDKPVWRAFWDYAMFGGSLLVPLLMGVAFANILQGVPIDQAKNYTGGFFSLLNPFALIGGITFVCLTILLGALYLKIKTTDIILERAIKTSKTFWLPSILLAGVFGIFATIIKSGQNGLNPLGLTITILAVIVLMGGLFAQRSGKSGWAFGLGVSAMASVSAVIFVLLFPNVMVSSTDPAFNLTIYNAASSAKTLEIMSFVVLIFLPIVLGYQAYNYWVFRKRLTTKSEDLHY